MKRLICTISIISALIFTCSTGFSQISVAIGPSTYYFISSNDDNLHYGLNARLAYDTHQILIDAGIRIFDKVTSTVKTVGYLNPEDTFDKLVIFNSVTCKSWELFLNGQYYFTGMPEEKAGVYGILGVSALYYEQTNNLSDHDPAYYPPAKFIDKRLHSSTQLTINTGIGAKYPLRHSSLYVEGKVSFPAKPYLDYQYPIENAIYVSVDAGIRITLKSHRNNYQRWDVNLNPFNF